MINPLLILGLGSNDAACAELTTFRVEVSAGIQDRVLPPLRAALGRLAPSATLDVVDPGVPRLDRRSRYWATQLDDAAYVVGSELEPEQVRAIRSAAARLRGSTPGVELPQHTLAIDLQQEGQVVRIAHWEPGESRQEAMARTLPVGANEEQWLAALVRLIPELDQEPIAALRVEQSVEGSALWRRVDAARPGVAMAVVPDIPLQLDASGSYDPDLGLYDMEYRWFVDSAAVASTREPHFTWTFGEPARPEAHRVEVVALSAGQQSVPVGLDLALDPRVALRDRTRALFVIGSSSVPPQRKVHLAVEATDERVGASWRWRQLDGPALTCASVELDGAQSCEDMERLIVTTRGPTLDLRPQRVGTYSFEVVQVAGGVPSRAVRASTTTAFTRGSIRGAINAHAGAAFIWTAGDSQLGIALEAGMPGWFGARLRAGPIFAFEFSEQRPSTAGGQVGVALDLLETFSAIDDVTGRVSPGWRPLLARDLSVDWRVEVVYQYQDPTRWGAVHPEVLPWEHSVCVGTGPVFQRRGSYVRIGGITRYAVGADDGIQLGFLTEFGIRDAVGLLPRGEASQIVLDAYERLHERRLEERECVEMLPASLGPAVEMLGVARESGALLRCNSAETWSSHQVRPRQLVACEDRIRAWWQHVDGRSFLAMRVRGVGPAGLVPLLSDSVESGAMVRSLFGDDCVQSGSSNLERLGTSLPHQLDLIGRFENALAEASETGAISFTVQCEPQAQGVPPAARSEMTIQFRSWKLNHREGPVDVLVIEFTPPEELELSARLMRWSTEPHRLLAGVMPVIFDPDAVERVEDCEP